MAYAKEYSKSAERDRHRGSYGFNGGIRGLFAGFLRIKIQFIKKLQILLTYPLDKTKKLCYNVKVTETLVQ